MFVVAVGIVGCKIFAPGHARALHAEAVEHAALHFLTDIEPDAGFEHELEQIDSFARISVARARVEFEIEFPVRVDETEVLKASRVIEQNARRQFLPACIVREVGIFLILGQGLWQILRDRSVEIDHMLIDQLHHHIGEGEFGQRRSVEDRVILQRLFLFDIGQAIGLDVNRLVILDQGDRQAGHLPCLHQARDFGIDLRRH